MQHATIWHLISFRVVPFSSHTLNPALFTLMGTFLEIFIRYEQQLPRCIHLDFLNHLKSSFQVGFDFRKEEKVARGEIWGIQRPDLENAEPSYKLLPSCADGEGAWSWCDCHSQEACNCRFFWLTAPNKQRKTSRKYSLFAVWAGGAHSCRRNGQQCPHAASVH